MGKRRICRLCLWSAKSVFILWPFKGSQLNKQVPTVPPGAGEAMMGQRSLWSQGSDSSVWDRKQLHPNSKCSVCHDGVTHTCTCVWRHQRGVPHTALGTEGVQIRGAFPEGGSGNLGKGLSIRPEKREKRIGAAAGERTEWLTAKCLDFT